MIPTKRKGKFGTTIRLAVLYESEHYATNVQHNHKLNGAEMLMPWIKMDVWSEYKDEKITKFARGCKLHIVMTVFEMCEFDN